MHYKYKIVRFNKNNYEKLLYLNSKRNEFNKLNKDFIRFYNETYLLKKIRMKKRVKLLKNKSEYLGYVWFEPQEDKKYIINSMNVIDSIDTVNCYRLLIRSIKKFSSLVYECEKNEHNYSILSQIGFQKGESIIEMETKIDSCFGWNCNNDEIVFEKFVRGRDEEIRCILQNEIFKNEDRIPLTIEDIIFDEIQNYYFDLGSIFIKLKDRYIGYGQIIIQDNYPYIVNFGILEKYRNKGYGKLFLTYLLEIVKENKFSKARIKVDSENYHAINLYTNLKFFQINESCIWQYKTSEKK